MCDIMIDLASVYETGRRRVRKSGLCRLAIRREIHSEAGSARVSRELRIRQSGDPKILIDARSRESAGEYRIDLWSSDRQDTTSPGAGSN